MMIFWRMLVTKQFLLPNDFRSIFSLQWLPVSVWLHTFFKISSFMLNRNSYRFWATWGWVNDDRIFIFGWTIPLMPYVVLAFVCVFCVVRHRHKTHTENSKPSNRNELLPQSPPFHAKGRSSTDPITNARAKVRTAPGMVLDTVKPTFQSIVQTPPFTQSRILLHRTDQGKPNSLPFRHV